MESPTVGVIILILNLDCYCTTTLAVIPMVLYAYGPVPSRRLGMSLGVNNIPLKICSYSCVYCQLGITAQENVTRKRFYDPGEISDAVVRRTEKVLSTGGKIDYITFVPDGEPTLDINLGEEILRVRETGIKVAVISNSSLIWMDDVRKELLDADFVSLKIDTVDPKIWRVLNRPSSDLFLGRIMEGLLTFSEDFKGELATETMLVSGLNDSVHLISETVKFIEKIDPDRAYISVPTRPPAEPWVRPPSEKTVNTAYSMFSTSLRWVGSITGYEGNLFAFTGDIVGDILGITSVHPMRKEALEQLLSEAGENWSIVERLISEGLLMKVEYAGEEFYVHRTRE